MGGWLAPEETDLQLMWNAFYYREAFLMGRFAGILHKAEDEAHYNRLAEQIKNYWNTALQRKASGRISAGILSAGRGNWDIR